MDDLVLKDFNSIAEELKVKLNNMSANIKEIEERLQAANINIPFEYKYEERIDTIGLVRRKYISWNQDKRCNKFRLLHITYTENDEVSSLPLIECKFDLRLQIYPHMQDFINKFTEFLTDYSRKIII